MQQCLQENEIRQTSQPQQHRRSVFVEREYQREQSSSSEENEVDNDFVPEEGDVHVLMSQANITHEQAYNALRRTRGDLVTAFFQF